jgi:membrane-bound metal-dependent hydrolase YbcI (DUF457 family)
MPHAVTHFLVPVILLELFRHFFVKNKKNFPLHYIFIGGLAGLIPDFDIAVYYLLSFFGFTYQEVHRTFLHTLFLPLLLVILSFFFGKVKIKKLERHHLSLRNIFLVIAFGIFIHLLLDATIAGIIIPFYPFFIFSVGINLISLFPIQWQDTIIPTLDAIILIIWIIHIEMKHRISDFF